MKSKLFLLFSFFCFLFIETAEAQIKLYSSVENYLQGRYETEDSLTFDAQYLLDPYTDYDFLTESERLNNKLKKQVRILEINDTVFLNCHRLYYKKRKFAYQYVPVFRIGNRLFFQSDAAENKSNFWTVGVPIKNLPYGEKWMYMLSNDKEDPRHVGKAHMLSILSSDETLKQAYEKEKRPESFKTIRIYLRKLSVAEKQKNKMSK